MRLMASQGLRGPLATVDATIGAKDRTITAPSNTWGGGAGAGRPRCPNQSAGQAHPCPGPCPAPAPLLSPQGKAPPRAASYARATPELVLRSEGLSLQPHGPPPRPPPFPWAAGAQSLPRISVLCSREAGPGQAGPSLVTCSSSLPETSRQARLLRERS